jgi:hypothetical protein
MCVRHCCLLVQQECGKRLDAAQAQFKALERKDAKGQIELKDMADKVCRGCNGRHAIGACRAGCMMRTAAHALSNLLLGLPLFGWSSLSTDVSHKTDCADQEAGNQD